MATSVARRGSVRERKRIPDHSFEAAYSGLHQSPASVPEPLLPAHASMLSNALEMPVALGRSGLCHRRSALPLIGVEQSRQHQDGAW